MQLYRHMPLKHSVHISRAADVGSQCQGVERADKVVRRFTAKLFCFVGHLCGFFVSDAVMQGQQSNTERVPGLLSGAEVEAADGGLTTPTLRGYLWLGQLAKAADFGDDFFPVHALSITGNCYLSMLFCYRFSVGLRHEH